MKDMIKNEIIAIFEVSQLTTSSHQRNAILLKQLYEGSNHDAFWSHFKNIITILLTNEQGSFQYIEKSIMFIGLFCSLLALDPPPEKDKSSDFGTQPLLKEILFYLLKFCNLNNDNLRVRSCLTISKIVDSLVGAEVSEELCENVEHVLLPRLTDSKAAVRQQAVITLYRLQDPDNPEDQIISEFIKLITSDSYPKVRQLCVEKIAGRKDVLQYILQRIRDTDQNVRLAAFKRLSKFATFLKISERHLVLHCGFLDNSESVKKYVSSDLIMRWLELSQNDILTFMKSLRLDADEKDIKNTIKLFETVLYLIFQQVSIETLSKTVILNEKKLIPFKVLNWEIVSFWRYYTEYLSNQPGHEEELEKMIPELIYFCEYIKEFCAEIMQKELTSEEFLEQQFILKQLFMITKTYDFGDETNRRCLNALVSNTLENVVMASDVTEALVSVLEKSIPDLNRRTQYICEIISEIMYPMNSEENARTQQEHQYKLAQLTVKITNKRHQQEEAIRNENFKVAEELKHELQDLGETLEKLKKSNLEDLRQPEKRTDSLTSIKCLDIAAAALLCPKVNELTFSLKLLKDDLIQQLLIHDNDFIRVKAFKCYAYCCCIDKTTASTGIHIFSTPIFAYRNGEECDTQTLLVCIEAVVDILRIYGPQLMAVPENGQLSESMTEVQLAVFAGGTSLTDILRGLVDLMDDDIYEIQEKAGLGLCKLILSDRILSSSLITRLILKWCNPISDSECGRLKQIIGLTLERLPLIPDSCDHLVDAVLMTIRAIYAAPRISPLADVNVENIAKFLLTLCKISPKNDYIQSTLAERLIKRMVKNSKSKLNGLYSKILLMLEIPDDPTLIEEILNYCSTLLEMTGEKVVMKNISKLITKLNLKTLEPSEQGKMQNKTTPDTIDEENEDVNFIRNLKMRKCL